MKLIFMARKVSAAPQDPSYTLNVLPPTLTASTLMELGQDIPIDTNLSNEPPNLTVSTLMELGQDIPIDNNLTSEPPTLAVYTAVAAQ